MDSVTETCTDEVTEALGRVRSLLGEMLPLLAVVESLLDVPEEERYVSAKWLEALGGGG